MTFRQRIEVLLGQQTSPAELPLVQLDVRQRAPHQTANPGANQTYIVLLEDGSVAYHKPFAGISVPLATAYGHHPDEVPINECAAWRLAHALGHPWDDLATPCVLRACEGEPGSLCARREGLPHALESQLSRPDLWIAAAFFDSLIAQQDRHTGNFRWDAATQRLGLIDHGFAFAVPGAPCNASAFVAWRQSQNQGSLRPEEEGALNRLLGSETLLGLGEVLRPEAGLALRSRARRMLVAGAILPVGEF